MRLLKRDKVWEAVLHRQLGGGERTTQRVRSQMIRTDFQRKFEVKKRNSARSQRSKLGSLRLQKNLGQDN